MGRTLRNRRKKRKKQHISHDELSTHVVLYVKLMKWMARYKFPGSYLHPAHFKVWRYSVVHTQQVADYNHDRTKQSTWTIHKKTHPPMTPHQALATFLLYEDSKGVDSFWSLYIALLPPSYTTPAFFNQEELTLLPRNVRTLAETQIQKVTAAYKELSNFFEEIKKLNPVINVTYERFRWAWFAINTRCVYMKQKKQEDLATDSEDNCILAPFLDLLNHSPTVETEGGYDTLLDGFVIKTVTSYKKYEQAFICYGPHGNDTLVLEYGFIVLNNHHSSVKFDIDDITSCVDCSLTTPQNNGLQSKKLQILRENNLQDNLWCGRDGLSWRLVTALKILCMDTLEIKSWKRVYTSDSISTHCDNQVKQLATRLLTRELHDNQLVLQNIEDKMAQDVTETEHFSLIQGLRRERDDLLQIAYKQLSTEDYCK